MLFIIKFRVLSIYIRVQMYFYVIIYVIYIKDLHHAFFQVYGVKNAPKFLLQKWTPKDLKIIEKIIKCIVRGHIAPLPPPQGTTKHPHTKLRNEYKS